MSGFADMQRLAVKKKPRGKPFGGKDDPRRQNGRTPKILCIPDILKKIMEGPVPDEVRVGFKQPWLQKSATFLDALMKTVVIRAMQGESWAVQFCAERTEGKVRENIRLEDARTPTTVYVEGKPPDANDRPAGE